MKAGKKTKTEEEKESSSAFFERIRPKFLDWKPPTEEEKALAVKARRDAKEAELKRVTELARKSQIEKAALSNRRHRSAAVRNNQRKRD